MITPQGYPLVGVAPNGQRFLVVGWWSPGTDMTPLPVVVTVGDLSQSHVNRANVPLTYRLPTPAEARGGC